MFELPNENVDGFSTLAPPNEGVAPEPNTGAADELTLDPKTEFVDVLTFDPKTGGAVEIIALDPKTFGV